MATTLDNCLLGAAVSVALGVYGQIHDPAGQQTMTAFFGSTLSFKAWMASVVLFFALIQLITALRMWGKITWPHHLPSWFGQVHRLSGTLAFLASLPVAFHCLWAIGFEPDLSQPRRFVHSLLGCFFYGAFVVKVFAVRSHCPRNWMLPAIGGTVFTSLVLLWLTSSLWFFTTVGRVSDEEAGRCGGANSGPGDDMDRRPSFHRAGSGDRRPDHRRWLQVVCGSVLVLSWS